MGRTKSHSFIERNGLSSLLEHPIFPLMYLRHIIQWVGINRGILTNCLSYKISHLQISQKSLSNIIYFYILNYLQKHFIYLKQYWSNRFSYFGFKVTFVASIKFLIRMSICFCLLTMTEGVFWTSLFLIVKKKKNRKSTILTNYKSIPLEILIHTFQKYIEMWRYVNKQTTLSELYTFVR